MRILIIALATLNILYFVGVYLFSVAFDQPPPLKEPNIPTIKLLTMNAGEASVPSGLSDACFTVGPYNLEQTARQMAEKLSRAGRAVRVKRQQTDRIQKYLVFLPQQPTREAAEKIIADIKKNKIKEYAIIDSGPYKNAIALGTFSDLDKARRHTEYVRFLGYDAKHTEQQQRATVFWVSYDETFSKSTPVVAWSKAIDPNSVAQKISETCEY
jgi:hypothetical protein